MSYITEKLQAILDIEEDVIESRLKEEFEKSFVYITGEHRDVIAFSGKNDFEDLFKEFDLREVLLSPLDDYKTESCIQNGKLVHSGQIEDMTEYLVLLKKVVSDIESYIPEINQANA